MLALFLALLGQGALLRRSAPKPRPSLLDTKQQEKALIARFLAGQVTEAELFAAVDQKAAHLSWHQAVQSLQHELPASFADIIRRAEAKQPFQQAQLDRAREVLNGMIETGQEEYDLKSMECMAFEERNRAMFGQVTADLSRLGSACANDNKNILMAKKDINDASVTTDGVKVSMEEGIQQCTQTRLENEGTLAILKEDLAVAEFIIRMTECKPGAALVQAPVIEECDHVDGTPYLTFKDPELASQAARLASTQAKDALAVALARAHPRSNATATALFADKVRLRRAQLLEAQKPKGKGVTTTPMPTTPMPAVVEEKGPAPVPPKTEPTADEAAGKCVLGRPDCGLLTDNMALMWGDVKDSVDELTAVMATNQANCKAMEELHNKEIETWQGVLQGKNVELTEATGALNANTEEQTERVAEKTMIEKEYQEVHGECVAVLHDILFTKICGVKVVRGEISKFSSAYGPTDILDCEVSDWIPQECSEQCVPEDCVPVEGGYQCDGGVQNMTRNVVQNKTLGANCPALLLEKACNNVPCPINCVQSAWSPFGKCTKECGGGVQQRSRNVEVRAANGGEACAASSQTQQCNVQSCDVDCVLAEWTIWGPCSKACGGGTQERVRLVTAPEEGKGFCFSEQSAERFESTECNVQLCPPEPTCIAKQDVVIAVDVSGSLKESGFNTVVGFVKELTSLYRMGVNESQIGVVEYSKEGKIVSPLTADPAELDKRMAGITFQRGVTDMAQGLSLAKTVLMEGRKSASSIVLLLTDGKPSFQFATRKAAAALRDSGVRLVMVPIQTYGDPSFMNELASDPVAENVLAVNGLKELAADTPGEARKLLTNTCAAIEMPEEPAAGKLDVAKVLQRVEAKQYHRRVRKTTHRPGH